LGLAICEKIVRQHHGQISATSEKNKGSTFIIRLPVKQPEANAQGRCEYDKPSSASSETQAGI
jgi:K+-sensing histidine kinase KdpD